MPDCPRLGRFFGGCKFEGRYDETSKPPSSPEQIEAMVEAFGEPLLDHEVESVTETSTIYVGDICIRCGKFVGRN